MRPNSRPCPAGYRVSAGTRSCVSLPAPHGQAPARTRNRCPSREAKRPARRVRPPTARAVNCHGSLARATLPSPIRGCRRSSSTRTSWRPFPMSSRRAWRRGPNDWAIRAERARTWDGVLGLEERPRLFTGGFLVGDQGKPIEGEDWKDLRDQINELQRPRPCRAARSGAACDFGLALFRLSGWTSYISNSARIRTRSKTTASGKDA